MVEDGKERYGASKVEIIASEPPSPQSYDVGLPSPIQAQIGRRLAAIYDEVLHQPIPDRFRLLLDELENSSSAFERTRRRKGDQG